MLSRSTPLSSMSEFSLTPKQLDAQKIVAGDATHILLEGGSRSGKTFLFTRNTVLRALKAPGSRHVILRYRLNHIKASIVMDTFPSVMRKAFPGVPWTLNKQDLFAALPGDSQVWFGGLDDKERTEKILGNEFATIYLNEISQIGLQARDVALTRLAQRVDQILAGRAPGRLKPRAYYDCNPPTKAHWAYALFHQKVDPETRQPLARPDDYAWYRINPGDNQANISEDYLQLLQGMSPRLQKRFLLGDWSDATPNALFDEADIDKWRVVDGVLPDMVRIVIGVDPSGADDSDGSDHDAIGIVVVGLGVDGNAYLLEDCTVKAGPVVWGRVVASAFDRHQADLVVGEINYGGAMVSHVILTARPRTPYKSVTASRGKAVRAEPISALYAQGKVRHVGFFRELEDELAAFSTSGYLGERSPNRADAAIWALSELFPGIVQPRKTISKPALQLPSRGPTAWMG